MFILLWVLSGVLAAAYFLKEAYEPGKEKEEMAIDAVTVFIIAGFGCVSFVICMAYIGLRIVYGYLDTLKK